MFVHNLQPLQSCGRGATERGREGVVSLSVTHGQPQRLQSMTSGPATLLNWEMWSSGASELRQVGTSHYFHPVQGRVRRLVVDDLLWGFPTSVLWGTAVLAS